MLHFWFTSREQCSCTLSKEKQNVHIFIQVYKQRKSGKWKIFEKEAVETYLEPCKISIIERFFNVDLQVDIPT